MNTDFTKLIDRYLANELTPTEKQDFEQELSNNKKLQEEVAFQKEIIEGIQRSATRSQIQKIGKRYHFQKGITTAGIIVAIILSVSLLSYFIYNSISSDENNIESTISSSLIEQLEAIAPIENLASEFFEWHGNDSIVLSKSGVLLSIPENAFLLNGKPYKQNTIIQWQEAKDAATIVKSGLSTMADDRLLETQGMFGFQAYTEKGEKLTVNPKVGVYVQTPVNEYKKDMQLFTGEKGKDGIINWTNPKPLEKIPVSVDIKDLDFYPKGYEAKLDELKKPTNKKYRDSLYLSFDESHFQNEKMFKYVVENIEIDSSNIKNKLVNWDVEVKWGLEYQNENKAYTILINAYLTNNYSLKNPNSFLEKNDDSPNLKLDFEKSEFENKNPNYRITNNFTWTSNGNIETILQEFQPLETKKSFQISFNLKYMISPKNKIGKSYSNFFKVVITLKPEKINLPKSIPPSKVLAFWKPEFNNTLLATREFEKRMATIHSTCDEKLLELYTSGLTKTMKSLDEKAVKMGYKQFNEYVSENIGVVNPDSPHNKNLERFYKNAIYQLQEEAKSNRRIQQEKDNQWDEDINNGRNKEFKRTQNREDKALNEEFEFNMKNVAKQLNRTLGFQIHGGGTIFNIDKYVWDATVARKTTTITDPETGKTAEIVYNPFSFQVKNSEEYSQLYAYLFPSQLNSYQRISPNNGKFDYPLNNDIDYDLCIVGISDKGYFYQEKKGVKKGNLGEINLTELSEKELDKKITSLNEARGIIDKMPIGDELAWLYIEQKNYVVQKQRKENEAFRNSIRKVIFPCWAATDTIAVADEYSKK